MAITGFWHDYNSGYIIAANQQSRTIQPRIQSVMLKIILFSPRAPVISSIQGSRQPNTRHWESRAYRTCFSLQLYNGITVYVHFLRPFICFVGEKLWWPIGRGNPLLVRRAQHVKWIHYSFGRILPAFEDADWLFQNPLATKIARSGICIPGNLWTANFPCYTAAWLGSDINLDILRYKVWFLASH